MEIRGITIKPTIGVGDALQFSSLPENYHRATGKSLVDISKPWFFDFNPYVIRNPSIKPTKITEMWNFGPKQYDFATPRKDAPAVYLSNAEIHAAVFKVPVVLSRPRLYRFEDFPYHQRRKILLHTNGVSHGQMPPHIIEHVIKKYKDTNQLFQIGNDSINYGIPRIKTPTLWELAEIISEALMYIGVDSGPGWIAACFPDVQLKILRTKPTPDVFKTWTPLEIRNIHSHWDDRCRQVFNPTDDDVGFTYSYRRL